MNAPPTPNGVLARLELARRLAIEASLRTLRWFPGPVPALSSRSIDALGAERKRDGSIVTAADRDAEAFIRDRVMASFPNDAILGEEFGEVMPDQPSGLRWVIDPIDGTASFACGVPLFGTILGVEQAATKDGNPAVPVAGVICLPALGEVVWGGQGISSRHAQFVPGAASAATESLQSAAANVSAVHRLKDATVVTTSLDYFARAGNAQLWPIIQAASGQTRGWSDCYGFVLLATGRVDAVVEPILKPWDICGVMAVIEGAGGRVTDFAGRPRTDTGDGVASNGRVHDEILALTKRGF